MRRVKNIFHLFLALCAVIFYRFPSRKMTVIVVSGTDGKTTTTHLIYQILKTAGKKVSMLSTIKAIISGKHYDTGFHVTTPSPFRMQKFIRMAKEKGSKYLILEVTSHALDQHRIFGVSIDIGVITNISHEHLDYHKTFDNYRQAKAKLLRNVRVSIINKDDNNYDYLVKKSSGKLISFALDNKGDYSLNDFNIKSKLLGKFNLYNILAAAVVAEELNIDKKTIAKGIMHFDGVPGRMEKVESEKNFDIYIDFAHKPNALKQSLITGKKLTKNKLIAVFGCAGLRDRLKRPIMGEIAAEYADFIILTAEDPRTEDVRNIIDEIARGCLKNQLIDMGRKTKNFKISSNKKYFWRIPDRQEAINFVIRRLTQKGDIILLLGKGHEQSMCYGRTEHHWSEQEAVNKALYGTVKKTYKA